MSEFPLEDPYAPRDSEASPPQPWPSPKDLGGPDEEPPFGILDIVEAFTALRHEYRTNTRESRQLAELLQQTTRRLEDVTRTVSRTVTAASDTSADRLPETRAWVDTLIEVDLILTRAVDAAERSISGLRHRQSRADDWDSLEQEIADHFATLGPLRRWFCRGFLQLVQESIRRRAEIARGRPAADPTAEGLQMVVARVRHLLGEHHIERVDTIGTPFDAQCMNAIEAIEAAGEQPGTVVRQLSPAYRWQHKLIRYAEVCVAQSQVPSDPLNPEE